MNERILRIVVSALEELNETREEKIPTDDALGLGAVLTVDGGFTAC